MNSKMIKIIGWAATAIGFGVTLVSNWVGEQQMDETINEKVNEAISNLNEGES